LFECQAWKNGVKDNLYATAVDQPVAPELSSAVSSDFPEPRGAGRSVMDRAHVSIVPMSRSLDVVACTGSHFALGTDGGLSHGQEGNKALQAVG
jgi:hypothetical protein